MLQNYQPQRNIRSFRRQSCFERPDKATGGGESRKLSTVRWSSGISATILDFRLPQKHVHGHVRMETGCKVGVGEGPGVTNSGAGARSASIREKAHGSFVRQDRWRHLVRWQTGAMGRRQ